MDGSIQLTAQERKMLLKVCRYGSNVPMARRAHVLLLLERGCSYREVRDVLFASNDLIAGCVARFRSGGVDAAVGSSDAKTQTVPRWLTLVAQWALTTTPQDFGYFRTRWSSATLAEVLWWEAGIRKSPESVRRGLRRMNFVWRRPRPIVGPTDAEYNAKLARIRRLLAGMPPDETAVFQDEVDVNLNPKIGCAWMVRGKQTTVSTPGNNVKRYLAGSLVWRTGTLIVSSPTPRRNTQLFLAHLNDLRCRMRGYRNIHVICDNAGFHKSRAVRQYLARWGHRLELHFLPAYSPETNPIERVWWHLHETVTRNHRRESIDELLDDAFTWFKQQPNYQHEIPNLYRIAA